VPAGVDSRGIADIRFGLVVDAEHIDGAADTYEATSHAETDHHDVFFASRLDRDCVSRIDDHRVVINKGLGRVADDIDAHSGPVPNEATGSSAGNRKVIESVAGADQHRLVGIGRGQIAVHQGVGADVGLRRRTYDIDPGRYRNADGGPGDAQGKGPNFVLVGGRDRNTVEARLRIQTGRAPTGQRLFIALGAAGVRQRIELWRVDVALRVQRLAVGWIVAFGGAQRVRTAAFDALVHRVVRVKAGSAHELGGNSARVDCETGPLAVARD